MAAFIDTNVVVYAFDAAEPEKRSTLGVLESGERLVVSTQVLLETWWVLTRRLASLLSEDAALEVVDELCRLPVVATDAELVRRAIRTCQRRGIAVWDALIVEAARS